ncbi:MAG: ScyD/ScyE family protein [Actinobacteria bacterium]|nr:ScyD/ScyE family protein [Actinomycetota bacterium]
MQLRRVSRLPVLVSVLALAMALLPATLAGADQHIDVIADGLNNPRGVFALPGPDIDAEANRAEFYVAEAGVGGDPADEGAACIQPDPDEPDFQLCRDDTGHVTQVDVPLVGDAAVTRIANLPSYDGGDEPGTPDENENGWFATGPHDVWLGDDGWIYTPIGLGANPEMRPDDPAWNLFGTLQAVDPAGADPDNNNETVADLADYEANNNPDESEEPDSNPYSVYAGAALTQQEVLAVDAGGNDVLQMLFDSCTPDTCPTGPEAWPLDSSADTAEIDTAAVLPPIPAFAPDFFDAPPGTPFSAQPVPTQIRPDPADPDNYLVGQLGGFAAPAGSANVWNLTETESGDPAFDLTVRQDGLSSIIDVEVGPDGMLYVLQIFEGSLIDAEFGGNFSGSLIRINESGHREVLLGGEDLMAPGGMAFGADGDLYITNCSVCPGDDLAEPGEMTGELIRFNDPLTAEPIFTIVDDEADTEEDQPIVVDVTENDSPSDELEVERVTWSPNAATQTGSILYQPKAHFRGTDTVYYEVCHESGVCATGVLTVTVDETETDRFDGDDRTATAIRVSRSVFPHGADTVVIARRGQEAPGLYADALAGSVLAHLVDAPVLLTASDGLDGRTAAEINRLGATQAYVLGEVDAIHPAVIGGLAEQTTIGDEDNVTRVGGIDRFETAEEIKAEIEDITGESAENVYVAEGQDPDPLRGFPDPLSVSYLAAHQVQPILLVRTDETTQPTARALQGVANATIVGGEVAVNANVEAQIDSIVGDVDRLDGVDRYHTAQLVADLAIDAGLNDDFLWLATGKNWPDALAAGPAVARDGSILMLIDPFDASFSDETFDYIEDHKPFTDVDLLGGFAAIPEEMEEQVQAAIS